MPLNSKPSGNKASKSRRHDATADVADQLKNMAARFQAEMNSFKSQLTVAQNPDIGKDNNSGSESHPVLTELVNSFSKFEDLIIGELKALELQLGTVNKSLDQVKQRVDNNLQWTYRNRLLVYGISESNNENKNSLLEQVVNIVNKTMKNKSDEIRSADISDCYRYGKVNVNKPRPVVIEFVRVLKRGLVFMNKSAFKGTKIVISEFLTKTKHALFREARKQHGKDCWTVNGNVYVNVNGGKRMVKDISEL